MINEFSSLVFFPTITNKRKESLLQFRELNDKLLFLAFFIWFMRNALGMFFQILG